MNEAQHVIQRARKQMANALYRAAQTYGDTCIAFNDGNASKEKLLQDMRKFERARATLEVLIWKLR